MDVNNELMRMQRTARLRPGLTPLQARLIDDHDGATTHAAIAQFEAVAEELSGHPGDLSAVREAALAAAATLARHWEILHGRPLPGRPPVARPSASAAAPAVDTPSGPDAFVQALGDCAVLAAIAADGASGETMRHGLRVVAPHDRGHDVLYALALNFNGEEDRADELLTDLLDSGCEEARAASALGFLYQTRGDERWRPLFERARRAAPSAQTERFVDFWTRFAEAPIQ